MHTIGTAITFGTGSPHLYVHDYWYKYIRTGIQDSKHPHPASESLEVTLGTGREVAQPVVRIGKLFDLLVLHAKPLHDHPLICSSAPFCRHFALDLFDPLGWVSRVYDILLQLHTGICLFLGELWRVAIFLHLTGKLVCTSLGRVSVCQYISTCMAHARTCARVKLAHVSVLANRDRELGSGVI